MEANNLKSQLKYISNLDEDIKKSLIWYTTAEYEKFNKEVISKNGNIEKDSVYYKHFKNIEDAFSACPPLDYPIITFRGKTSEKIYDVNSYFSTSLSESQAMNFSGVKCCIQQITVSAGSKVLPIYIISDVPNELEVLLDRKSKMFLTGTTLRNVVNKNKTSREIKILFTTYTKKDIIEIKENVDTTNYNKSSLAKERIIQFLLDDKKDDPEMYEDEDFIRIQINTILGRIDKDIKLSEHDKDDIIKRINMG